MSRMPRNYYLKIAGETLELKDVESSWYVAPENLDELIKREQKAVRQAFGDSNWKEIKPPTLKRRAGRVKIVIHLGRVRNLSNKDKTDEQQIIQPHIDISKRTPQFR